MLQGALSILVSSIVCFCSTPGSFGDTWIGPIHGHLDTLLAWYTLRVLLFVGGKVSCAHIPFRVNSSFLTPLMFPSLVVLSYYSTENMCVTSIILCTNCSTAWMTLLSSDTLPNPTMHFFDVSCQFRHHVASCEWTKHRKRSWFCWS